MTARDDILGRVRSALQQASRAPVVPREYRDVPGHDDLLDLFADRVSDYRAEVVWWSADDVQARVAERLGSQTAIVPADLPWAVHDAVVDVGQSPQELDRLDAVVTAAPSRSPVPARSSWITAQAKGVARCRSSPTCMYAS